MIPLKDRNPTLRPAVVTVALIITNVVVHVLTLTLLNGTEPVVVGDRVAVLDARDRFLFEYAAIPCELTRNRPLDAAEFADAFVGSGEGCAAGAELPRVFPDKRVWLAVVLSMFLHADWLHLGFNMLFLWIFGNNIEDHLGPLRYLAFYLAAGTAATGLHVGLQMDSTIPVIGASGAIAGVMGAYLVWFPDAPVRTLFFFVLIWFHDIRARWLLAFWFVTQFFTAPDSQVAWAAHVGGFVFGAVVAVLIRSSVRARRMAFVARHRAARGWDNTGGSGPPPPTW